MNDIRRTILWVVFGFSMVLLWDRWQLYNGHAPTFFPSPPPQAQPAAATAPSAQASAAASAGVPVVPAGAVPAAVPASPPAAVPSAPSTTARQLVVVTTDRMRLSFDTEGGTLVRTEMLHHRDLVDPKRNLVLLDSGTGREYVAQSGMIGASASEEFPTHKTPMTVEGARDMRDGENELVVTFRSADVRGTQLVKQYTLRRGSYLIGVRHTLANNGTAPVSPSLYVQLVRDGNKPPGESAFYATFTGPAVYTDAQHFQKVEFSDIKKKNADHAKEASDGYIAMVQHYFASAWLLADGQRRTFSMDAVTLNSTVPDCCYRATMIAPMEPVAPGASRSIEARLYVGPQEEKKLEAIAKGLELVKDYGWFTILAKPLYWLLDKLYGMLQNWGWAIVGLVLLLKIAFYWLNAKAYASMAKMKAINPRIMEMRERLKDNPQQMQQEMMRMYREEKVNPMGGCFPIMIQIPVFIALYWVLLSSVEIRNAPWVLWITDLSAPDPYYIMPLVMTLTTLLQTALNPLPPDPLQAKLMWLMPLVFSVMFFFFPSGLVLYWITNNILSIAQQWIINTRMGVPPQFNLPKFK